MCIPMTSNLRWRDAPGAVSLPAAATGLDRPSLANATLVTAIDKSQLIEWVGQLDRALLERVLAGIDLVLDRGRG